MIAMLDNNQDKMTSFVEEWFEAMEKHSRLKLIKYNEWIDLQTI